MDKVKRLVFLGVLILAVILLVTVSCAKTPASPPLTPPPLPPNAPASPPPIIPGKSLLEAARIEFEDYVEMKAGETKSLDVTLDTLKHGPGEVTYKIYRVAKEYSEDKLPMLEDLDVSIEPSTFTASPGNTYHSKIKVRTTSELPSGEYVLLFDWHFEGVETGSGWITINVE